MFPGLDVKRVWTAGELPKFSALAVISFAALLNSLKPEPGVARPEITSLCRCTAVCAKLAALSA